MGLGNRGLLFGKGFPFGHICIRCALFVLFSFFIFCELNFDPGVIWFCFFLGGRGSGIVGQEVKFEHIESRMFVFFEVGKVSFLARSI